MKTLMIILAMVLLAAVAVFLKLERFSAQREKLKQCFNKQCFKMGGHKCAKTEDVSSMQAASVAPETKPPAAQEKPAAPTPTPTPTPTPSVAEAPKAEAKVSAAETRPATAVLEKPSAAPTEQSPASETPITALAPPCIDLGVKHCLPQDSILRRHLLATLRVAVEAEMGASPSDSILQRHYGSEVERKICSCLTDESVAALQCAAKPCAEASSVTDSAPAPAEAPATVPTSAPAPKPVEAVKQPEVKPAATTTANAGIAPTVRVHQPTLPQDSILRRHFMTTLRADIESAAGPRPTDSVLQRHYDGLIEAKLNQRLTEL